MLRGFGYDFLRIITMNSQKDFIWAKYPTDKEIIKNNVKEYILVTILNGLLMNILKK